MADVKTVLNRGLSFPEGLPLPKGGDVFEKQKSNIFFKEDKDAGESNSRI
jgi:hypothetical protein